MRKTATATILLVGFFIQHLFVPAFSSQVAAFVTPPNSVSYRNCPVPNHFNTDEWRFIYCNPDLRQIPNPDVNHCASNAWGCNNISLAPAHINTLAGCNSYLWPRVDGDGGFFRTYYMRPESGAEDWDHWESMRRFRRHHENNPDNEPVIGLRFFPINENFRQCFPNTPQNRERLQRLCNEHVYWCSSDPAAGPDLVCRSNHAHTRYTNSDMLVGGGVGWGDGARSSTFRYRHSLGQLWGPGASAIQP